MPNLCQKTAETSMSMTSTCSMSHTHMSSILGSGRQSLTRLAAHIADFTCFQIELSKNYGTTEWRDDLKKVMLQAGLENKATVFLFSDTQVQSLALSFIRCDKFSGEL